ncbi:DUF6980 family protein [Streptomyces sp. NPDC004646]
MTDHCCESMTAQVNTRCPHHANPFTCPDALIDFTPRFQEYALIIHDGGTSSLTIDYCPWCGHRLPESQRDRWYDELEHLGVDPAEDEIPPAFQTADWLTALPREGV